ncbi:MAG TPA: hypothetical protein VIZ43_10880 [Trebonia sp.]
MPTFVKPARVEVTPDEGASWVVRLLLAVAVLAVLGVLHAILGGLLVTAGAAVVAANAAMGAGAYRLVRYGDVRGPRPAAAKLPRSDAPRKILRNEKRAAVAARRQPLAIEPTRVVPAAVVPAEEAARLP